MPHVVRSVALDHVMELRVRVLRRGTPVDHCRYPEDERDDVVHLAIDDAGRAVATSTWFMNPCPEVPEDASMQLKGMAVELGTQTSGLGRALIDAGISLAKERGARLVWARARDSALGFYEKCGFRVVGEGFIDGPTAMPHHIVVRDIG